MFVQCCSGATGPLGHVSDLVLFSCVHVLAGLAQDEEVTQRKFGYRVWLDEYAAVFTYICPKWSSGARI